MQVTLVDHIGPFQKMVDLSNDETTPTPQPPTTQPPTTQPPITQPPSGCGSPQWANDMYCDDENNNASCNYDGGACCSNSASGNKVQTDFEYDKLNSIQCSVWFKNVLLNAQFF